MQSWPGSHQGQVIVTASSRRVIVTVMDEDEADLFGRITLTRAKAIGMARVLVTYAKNLEDEWAS